ncbi:MAG TPA: phosphatidate cytidylyltransferase [Actinomycetota bacterium]|nr:phosphatidate cytidylyltransferase [Actinomycetota bacterium]
MEPAPSEVPPPEPAEPSAGRNLPVAIITGLTLAGLIFGTLFWKPAAFFVLAGGVILLALQEFYAALSSRGYRPATALGLAGGALVLVGAYWKGPQALSFGVVLTLVGAFLWYLVDPERSNVATNIGVTVLGVVYIPVMGAHAILIRDLPQGIAHEIAFIGAVAFYDIGAYASGSLFGKHKIAPAVSPSKTWEGAAGATIFVFVSALLIGPHLGFLDLGSSALLALAASVLAPLGDLAESMLKRDLDIKDMGTILPGHGGALDRLDALLFTAPAAYWIMRVVVL